MLSLQCLGPTSPSGTIRYKPLLGLEQVCFCGSSKCYQLANNSGFDQTKYTFLSFLLIFNPRMKSPLFDDISLEVGAMAWWLRCLITSPRVLTSKPLGVSKVDSAFHPSEANQISTKNL